MENSWKFLSWFKIQTGPSLYCFSWIKDVLEELSFMQFAKALSLNAHVFVQNRNNPRLQDHSQTEVASQSTQPNNI